jgi:putative ABC transport system substrate-binding protein
MRRAYLLFVLIVALLLSGGCGTKENGAGATEANAPKETNQTQQPAEAQKTFRIGITQIAEHPALDAIRKGILDALKDKGVSVDADYKNAQNDQANTVTIAQSFAADKKDLIIAISTPSAQAAAEAAGDIPVQFVAVTDPVAAGLVEALDKPKENITGTSDQVSMDKQLEMIKSFLPDVKNIGIVFSSGEVNSQTQVNAFTEAAKNAGINVLTVGVAQPTEVQQAAQSLTGKIDAFFITVDNLVVASFDALLNEAKKAGIPVFASDIDTVKRGAIATYGIDYYKFGYQSGEMAARILQGEKISSIPVEVSKEADLYINAKAAETFNIAIPESLQKQAKEIFQ